MKTNRGDTNNHEDLQNRAQTMNAHRLLVISGRQSGAQSQIDPDTRITIGTNIDNDIVLFSEEGQPTKLTLEVQKYSISIQVAEGELLINDQLIAQGGVHGVTNDDVFELNGTTFRFDVLESNQSSDSVEVDQKVISRRSDEVTSTLFSRPMMFLSLGLGVVMLVSAISTGMVNAVTPQKQQKTVQQQLIEDGYRNLNYNNSTASGVAMITGSVRNQEEKNRLVSLIDNSEQAIELDVQVDENLIASVKDLYRVNGLKVDVSVLGLGEIQVWSNTNNTELLDSVEQRVKNDLNHVVSVTRSNTLPSETIVVKDDSSIAITDPEKQVTLVVAGESGYVMTKDKSRYFVGSMLPSGHEIKKIQGGSVYVQVDDQLVELEF